MQTTKDSKKASKLIEWNSSYSFDIPSIDDQHRLLVSMIQHLQEAMLEGRTKAVVAPLFGALNRYTKFHFEHEEQLLEQNGYPGFADHREQHAKLIVSLKDLEKKYANGTLNAGAPLMQLMRSWLLDHICTHDRDYAAFLKEKGVS